MFVAFIAVLIVVGIAGTLLPLVPGLSLVWGAVVLFAVVEELDPVGWVALTIVSAIAGIAMYLGFRLPQRAAAGALGIRGQLFAVGLAVIGFFVVPIVGAPLGFALGVYVANSLKNRDEAWNQTTETLKALVIASGVQFAAACAMGLVWVAWVVGDRITG